VACRGATAAVAFAGLVLSAPLGSAADMVFPAHDVTIRIEIRSDGSVEVDERYALTATIAASTFQFLRDSCTTLGPIAGSIDGRPVTFEVDSDARPPWTVLRLEPAATSSGGSSLHLHYSASVRGGEAAVPIVMPAAALEAAEGDRGARVAISAHWAGPSGAARIIMPRFERTASTDLWETRLLATPSSVRVEVAPAIHGPACDRTFVGASGGLEWRFALFVATMAIWVPVYLWWFGGRWHPGS
jgi:hypothetical protein